MGLIFKPIDDENLYEQLIGRLYHIERAFLIRRHIKLHYSTSISKDVTKEYVVIRQKYDDFFATYEETLLWFMTVELWSRFLYPKTKKGIFKLVAETKDDDIKKKHGQFQEQHKDVVDFIKTQRNRYLAHADEAKWNKFPNVWDKEYDEIIKDLKELMLAIGNSIGSQQLPTNAARAAEHTCQLFDDLLKINSPEADILAVSLKYNKDVEKFLSE